jgi:GT2 family glycosyltransferase
LDGLRDSVVAPDHHVVVAVDDDEVEQAVRPYRGHPSVVPLHATTPRLPMAAARNLGARTAIETGAELLIFLDVDCIPAPNLVGRYVCAAEDSEHRDSLLCGPVTYLRPPGPDGYDLASLPGMIDPHPARPAPDDGVILASTDHRLFWSLSFAVTAEVWQRVGGFCTRYTGYGGEDTDYGQKAAAASVPMRWVGGAHAFHQHHPISDPPVEHVADIVRNAHTFHERWGWWPMEGWLDAFEGLGLIRRQQDGTPRVLLTRDVGAPA